jgi:hypothetical protein
MKRTRIAAELIRKGFFRVPEESGYIENNEERVAAGLNDPTAVFVYRRVDYARAYRAKSFHGTDII